ncbi:MAG: hypothetical protein AB1Z98_11930 [Nannocystaceae bacterium]
MSEEPLPDEPSLIARYRWRVRLGTTLTIAIVASTLGASWFYFVRAPGPRSVCDHVAELRRRFPQDADRIEAALRPMTGGNPGSVSQATDQLCTWYFTTERKQLGFVAYGQRSRCVTFASTPAELLSCL